MIFATHSTLMLFLFVFLAFFWGIYLGHISGKEHGRREGWYTENVHCEKLQTILLYLHMYAVTEEYDCPGDTPELCGYQCQICHELSGLTEHICHKSDCPLSELKEQPTCISR